MPIVNDAAMAVNVNVGVMGHVDSGKTSLVGALSTCLSTCALDKHPQSKARGITLDLGFSSFTWKTKAGGDVRFTLVDCPGHASLIRTIIGATQIIDLYLLVVDATKGIQTQTAECLVLAEVSPCDAMVVVLNKIDQVDEKRRDKVEKVVRKVLAGTKFKGCDIVPASAKPGEPVGIEQVAEKLVDIVPERVMAERSGTTKDGNGGGGGIASEARDEVAGPPPLIYAVDHCFAIKGQGTVLTGTVLQGSLRVNQMVAIPRLGLSRKVKTMQVFKQPVEVATKGSRVAVCTTQIDPKLIERDYLSQADLPRDQQVVATFDMCVGTVSRIAFFKENVSSGSKIHLTLGYTTVLAEAHFFLPERKNGERGGHEGNEEAFDLARDYAHLGELEALGRAGEAEDGQVYAVLVFDKAVTCPVGTAYIASRLDLDVHTKQCRLAFHGTLLRIHPFDGCHQSQGGAQAGAGGDSRRDWLRAIRIGKLKSRAGKVERIDKSDPAVCIVSGFFTKDSDISKFLGQEVYYAGPLVSELSEGGNGNGGSGGRMRGTLESSFGKSGKVKVRFEASAAHLLGGEVTIAFKKYLFR